MRGWLVLAVCALCAALVAVAVVLVTGRESSREDALPSLLAEVVDAGAPGVLVLVEDGSERQSVAAGLADRARRRRMFGADRFRIGSITKTFVAAVVLQLVAEGRLALDAPVARRLPGLVPSGITVRQLLSHRSGLSDYVDDPRVASGDVSGPRRLVALAVSRGRVGRPGERFAYSSTNYLVLGLLVQQVTGSSLEEELERRIFVPLRLTRTSFDSGTLLELPVHGYDAPTRSGIIVGEREDTMRDDASWAWAAGAIVADAKDLSDFFAALLDGRLLPATLLEEMVPEQGYGLGLAAFRTSCGTAVGHTGNLLGQVSVVWSRQDGSRRVVMMANTYPLGADAERAFHRALDVAFCG